MNKSVTLRRLLEGSKLFRIVGAHDGLSARLIEDSGFEAVWASSLGISVVHAMPDADILTMTDYLQATRVMNSAIDLPIVADCNAGFGNINNVIRLVHEYERCGIAGVCIEDKVFPKTNSLFPGEQLLSPIGEFAEKLRKAKSSQTSPDFVVIARVEALIAGLGFDDAVKRALAYEEAGADAIVIHSKASGPEEIVEFMARWRGQAPIIVIPTTYPRVTLQELEGLGIRAAIYACQGLRSSIRGMKEVFAELFCGSGPSCVENKIATLEEVFESQRTHEWVNL